MKDAKAHIVKAKQEEDKTNYVCSNLQGEETKWLFDFDHRHCAFVLKFCVFDLYVYMYLIDLIDFFIWLVSISMFEKFRSTQILGIVKSFVLQLAIQL